MFHVSPALQLVVGNAILLAVASCGDPVEFAAVYEERLPIPAEDPREFAYRVTLFEYAGEVGGHVEFFELDGQFNTPDQPYFRASGCTWFGESPIRDGRFRVEAPGVDGSCLLLRAEREDRGRALRVTVLEPGGTLREGTSIEDADLVLEFQRNRDLDATPRCESSALIWPGGSGDQCITDPQ